MRQALHFLFQYVIPFAFLLMLIAVIIARIKGGRPIYRHRSPFDSGDDPNGDQ